MDYEYFATQVINGLTLGSIYGLIAIGYTMVFGIIGMVNFAHGDVFMLSTFIALIFLMILLPIIGTSIAAIVFALDGPVPGAGQRHAECQYHDQRKHDGRYACADDRQ